MASSSPKVGRPMDIETGSIRSVSRSSIVSGNNHDHGRQSKWESNLLRVRSGSVASAEPIVSGYAHAPGGPKSPNDDKQRVPSAVGNSTPTSPSGKQAPSTLSSPTSPYRSYGQSFLSGSQRGHSNAPRSEKHKPNDAEMKRAGVLDSMTGIKDPTYDGSYTTPSRDKDSNVIAVTNPIVAYKLKQTYYNKKNDGGGGGWRQRNVHMDKDTENWADLVKEGATVEETLQLAEKQAAWNLSEKKRMDAEEQSRKEKEAAEAREQAELDRLDAEHRARIREQEKALDKEEKAQRRAAHAEMRQASRALEQARKNERAEERRRQKEQRAAEKRSRAEARAAEKRAAAEARLNGEPAPEGAETIATDAEVSDDDEEAGDVSEDNDFHSAVDDDVDSEAGSSVTEAATVEQPAPKKKRGGLLRRLSNSLGKNYKGNDESETTATTESKAAAAGAPGVKRRRSWLGKNYKGGEEDEIEKTDSKKPAPIAKESDDERADDESGSEDGEDGTDAEEGEEGITDEGAAVAGEGIVNAEEKAQAEDGAATGAPVKRSKSWLRIFGRGKDRPQRVAKPPRSEQKVIPIDDEEDEQTVDPSANTESKDETEQVEATSAPPASGVVVEKDADEEVENESETANALPDPILADDTVVGEEQVDDTKAANSTSKPVRRKSWLSRRLSGRKSKSSLKSSEPSTAAVIPIDDEEPVEKAASDLKVAEEKAIEEDAPSDTNEDTTEAQDEADAQTTATQTEQSPQLTRRKSWLARKFGKSQENLNDAASTAESASPSMQRRKSWLGKNYKGGEDDGAVQEGTDSVQPEQSADIMGVGNVAAPTLNRRKSWLGPNYEKTPSGSETGNIGENSAAMRSTTSLSQHYSHAETLSAYAGSIAPSADSSVRRKRSFLGLKRRNSRPKRQAPDPNAPIIPIDDSEDEGEAREPQQPETPEETGETSEAVDRNEADGTSQISKADTPKQKMRRRSFLGIKYGRKIPVNDSEAAADSKTIPVDDDVAEPDTAPSSSAAAVAAGDTEDADDADASQSRDEVEDQPEPIAMESVEAVPRDSVQKSPLSRRISWGPIRRRKSKKANLLPVGEPSSILVNSRPTSVIEGDAPAAVQKGDQTSSTQPTREEESTSEAVADKPATIEEAEREDQQSKEGVLAEATSSPDAPEAAAANTDTAEETEPTKSEPSSPTPDSTPKKRGLLSKVFNRNGSRKRSPSDANSGAVASDDRAEEHTTVEESTDSNGPVASETKAESTEVEAAAKSEAADEGKAPVESKELAPTSGETETTPSKEAASEGTVLNQEKTADATANAEQRPSRAASFTDSLSNPHLCEKGMTVKRITPSSVKGHSPHVSVDQLPKGNYLTYAPVYEPVHVSKKAYA